jgi:UDP-3-O-[3-hydroxymyristoyl] glucosamine N-acyltransferase
MPSLTELSAIVGGTVVGDGSIDITGISPLDDAKQGDLTFITNPKYLSKVADTKASAIIANTELPDTSFPTLVVKNPYLAFAKILTEFSGKKPAPRGVMPGATVSESAQIAEGVTISPGCYVGERVVIGLGTFLHPNVVIYDDVVLGEDCLIHAGVVVREGCILGDRVIVQPLVAIGGDGFGFAPDGTSYYKIPQVGNVVIGDDVEIGSCSCIDRAALTSTVIKRGTKIDNLVQVAHNVEIGEDTVVAGQVGFAGSAKIGNHCTFGGQTAIAGHLSIGDNVMIGGKSGVSANVESDQILSGYPLMPHKEWLKSIMTLHKLPTMRKDLHRLKKMVEKLEKALHQED